MGTKRPDQIVKAGSAEIIARPQMNERQNFILAAMEKAGDADQLEKMLATYERMEAMEAKRAYTKAMAAFKAKPPTIIKDKIVSFKQTSYKHATLAKVAEKINAALSSHGLSSFWATNHRENGEICVTTRITHEMGHTEETTICAPPDNSGAKNSIQQIGSTITYLQRYGLMALCGLAAHDDDDGAASAVISEEDSATMHELISKHIQDSADFLKWVGVESVENMTASDFKKAKAAIEDIKKQKGV